MIVSSVFPFIVFYIENREEATMDKCIEALERWKEKRGKGLLSRKNLQNAIKYYEEILIDKVV